MLVKLIALFSLLTLVCARKVEVAWNPNCTIPECAALQNTTSYLNIVYVKSTGDNDIIHTLYSSINSFTILIFKSDLNGQLVIDWKGLIANQSDSIQIQNSKMTTEQAVYILPTVYEFNDNNGDADMTKLPQNSTFFQTYPTEGLVWNKFSPYKNALGVLEGRINNRNETNSFKFVIKNPGTDTRDTDLPHLLLKPESSSIDFIINVPATFELSKFAAEFVFASSGAEMSQTTKTTMDDEYTPGTFKIWNFEFNNGNSSVNYFQCKPIFYYYEPKALENSTLAIKYDTVASTEMPPSIAKGLFTKSYVTNFSFGIEGTVKDGYFYNQTEYSSWSFSVGMGSPPVEKMSFIVTLVIAIGFGLPACIIVVGVIVMVVRKIRGGSRRTDFQVLD